MIALRIKNFFTEHKDLIPTLLLFLLSSLYFFGSFFYNRVIWGQDTPKIIFPFIYLLDKSFKHLQLPLWTPDIYFGFPVGADGQLPWFYPFSALHIFLPLHLTITVLSCLHVFLAGLFTYFFARIINLSRFASIFAGIAFMFNGFIVAHMQYFSHIYAYAYLPLILLLVELAIQRKDHLYFILAGGSFGLQLLSGHPNIPIMTIIYSSLYTLLRFKEKINKSFIGIATIMGLGFIIALPYVLYTFRLIPLSIRGGGVDFADATNASLSLFDLITLIFPNFFFDKINNSWAYTNTWHFWGYWGQIETTGYIGILTLLFAFFSFFGKNCRKIAIFTVLLLISFILALGKNTPVYWFLLQVPILDGLRAPGRFLYLIDFSLIILASYGIMALSATLDKLKAKINAAILLIFPLICLLTLAGLLVSKYYPELLRAFLKSNYNSLGYVQNIDKPEEFQHMIVNSFQNQTPVGLLLLLLAVILLFIYVNVTKRNILKSLILILFVSDLFLFAGKVNKEVNYNDLFAKNSSIPVLQQGLDNNSGRIYTFMNFWSDLLPDQLLTYNILEANGFASLPLRRFQKWQKLAEDHWLRNNPLLFQTGSIRYVYSLKNGSSILSSLENPLPRAYLVGKWSLARNDSEALSLVSAERFDPNTVILETDDLPSFNKVGTLNIKPVEILSYEPDYAKINYTSSEDGILVLTDTNYPGWEAYLNGEKVSIFQANYLFRAIKAPTGFNIVEFKYQPKYLNISIVASLGTSLFITYLLARKLLRKIN